MMMRGFGVLMLGLTMLTACAGRPLQQIDSFFSAEDPIAVREVWRHAQCGTSAADAKITLFTGREVMLRWAAARSLPVVKVAGHLPAGGAYALVELGRQLTTGRTVAISAAAGQRGTTLLLRGTFFAGEASADDAHEAPCVLVNLPPNRVDAARLYDQGGNLRAMALNIAPAL